MQKYERTTRVGARSTQGRDHELATAVAVRDERMKRANARIQQLAEDLNASIRKYNELITNRNSAEKSPAATHAPP